MTKPPKHILISRPDSIGDVMLTLPVAGWIRRHLPTSRISFLGRNYTRDVVACSENVDTFFSLDAWGTDIASGLRAVQADVIIHALPDRYVVPAAHAAGIPLRIGTARRKYTWRHLNRRHWFSRKNSELHEAQLNLKLLTSLGLQAIPGLAEIPELYGFSQVPPPPSLAFSKNERTWIFHPKSKGSAVDFPLESWAKLMHATEKDGPRILITGTEAEGHLIGNHLPDLPHVTNLCGKLSLTEFIGLISTADALVACSTGPLHIAAALGIHAVGLYTTQRPMHPGRWGPIGQDTTVIAEQHSCDRLPIAPERVRKALLRNP